MSFGQPSSSILPDAALGKARVDRALATAPAGMPDVRRPAPTLVGLAPDAPGSARLCALLATLCLGFVLPVLMVVANKSAPASLGAAALFANLAVVLAGRGEELWRRYRTLISRPTSLVVMGLIALFVASFAWTIDPALTRRGLIEGMPGLIFALATGAAWPLAAPRGAFDWLALGLLGAALLIGFESRTGMPLHAMVRARGEAWDLKRSAIPPVLLLWPAVAYYASRGQRLIPLGLLAAAATGIVFSHSGAPGFALILAVPSYALAATAPRAALTACGAILALLIVGAPWTGVVASRTLPDRVENALSEEHASHRIQIWTAFERRVSDRPVLGHGFDASYKVSAAARPDNLPPGPDNSMMLDNHPHDVFLQIWVELGLLGGLAAAGAAAYVLHQTAKAERAALPARLALLASVIAIGLVGLSAWQPWWLASIAAALIWFDLRRLRPDI